MSKTEKHITLVREQFTMLLQTIVEDVKEWKDFEYHKHLPEATDREMQQAVSTLKYSPPENFAEVCYMEVLREFCRDQMKRLLDQRDKYQLHLKSYQVAALLQFIYSKDWIAFDEYKYGVFYKISEEIR